MTYAVRNAEGNILEDFETYFQALAWAENYLFLTGWAPTILVRDGDFWETVEVVT